jgi:uncharacterized RDD family membrane protein YckC
MKPKFQPDFEPHPDIPERQMVDPQAYDASGRRFAASLEEGRPRFVLEEAKPDTLASALEGSGREEQQTEPQDPPTLSPAQSELTDSQAHDADAWRQEVASRVSRYRSRRRQPPRYPSLQLRFEPADLSLGPSHKVPETVESSPVSRLAVATELSPATSSTVAGTHSVDAGAKVIEFPRPPVPAPPRDELAEPLFDRPRILEVPEVLPPPPALGGILIETPEDSVAQKRPGFEVPLQGPSKSRRLAAAAFDLLLVLAAFAIFAYTFFRLTTIVPPVRQGLGAAAALIVVFWAGYQYLLLAYTGTTPGLKLARLRLTRFDGRPASRNLRRWRVVTSLLSGFSLALGYAWCFFDEDELCWHDRITRTYLAPKARPARD